jgi:molybdopterin synthase sulfur carrier subunit
MPVKVQIPAPLRQHTGEAAVIEVSGATVKDALAAISSSYPALAERILENGQLRRFVNIFVNDEDIRYLDGPDTALAEGDQVSIIPAVAGGLSHGA